MAFHRGLFIQHSFVEHPSGPDVSLALGLCVTTAPCPPQTVTVVAKPIKAVVVETSGHWTCPGGGGPEEVTSKRGEEMARRRGWAQGEGSRPETPRPEAVFLTGC